MLGFKLSTNSINASYATYVNACISNRYSHGRLSSSLYVHRALNFILCRPSPQRKTTGSQTYQIQSIFSITASIRYVQLLSCLLKMLYPRSCVYSSTQTTSSKNFIKNPIERHHKKIQRAVENVWKANSNYNSKSNAKTANFTELHYEIIFLTNSYLVLLACTILRWFYHAKRCASKGGSANESLIVIGRM